MVSDYRIKQYQPDGCYNVAVEAVDNIARIPGLGETLLAHVPSHHNHRVGEWIGIRPEVDHVVTFPVGADHPGRTPAADVR